VRLACANLKHTLSEALHRSFWPSKEGGAESERHLLHWFASAMTGRGCMPYFEVAWTGNKHIDALFVSRDARVVIACESKLLYDTAKRIGQARADLHRLNAFKPTSWDSLPLGKNVVRVLIASYWQVFPEDDVPSASPEEMLKRLVSGIELGSFSTHVSTGAPYIEPSRREQQFILSITW